VLILLIKF